MRILSYQEFLTAYKTSHPHDTVKRKAVEGVSIWSRIGVLLALIAVNILSASHTIPVMLETVKADNNDIKTIIAIAAFVGIEFTMILFMVFGNPSWIRTSVISGALVVAVIANISSALTNITNSVYQAAPVVGIILGLFAPLANLGIGEVYRTMQERAANAKSEADSDYNKEWKRWDDKVRQQYQGYLKKSGITDVTQQLALLAGTVEPPTINDEPIINEPPRARKKQTVSSNGRRVEELATQIRADGNQDMSYADLQRTYKASPNTVKKAKALLQ